MDNAVSGIRLFLFTCSGEDNFILKRCSWGIQRRFALIGFFVLMIFVGCFASATLFCISLFQDNSLLSICIGLFWGAMVVNIYLLLLHTISPAIIPLAAKKTKKDVASQTNDNAKQQFLSTSMLLRVVFMMLLAIIVAQPLNYSLLGAMVKDDIALHKLQEKVKLYTFANRSVIHDEMVSYVEFSRKMSNVLSPDQLINASHQLQIIQNKIQADCSFSTFATGTFKKLHGLNNHLWLTSKQRKTKANLIGALDNKLNQVLDSDDAFLNDLESFSFNACQGEFLSFKKELTSLIQQKRANYQNLNDLLNKSNFYVKTIQLLLVNCPWSWFIMLTMCFIFLLPIYFKYKVRDLSGRLFAEKDYPKDIQRLRSELIDTKDFNWLKNKLLNTDIHDIRTSDYYFQRMLVEHKIIIEEYETCKKRYSQILSENIRTYNKRVIATLNPLLAKLKEINSKRHDAFAEEIELELSVASIQKYEYWLDMPFRTKRMHDMKVDNNEVGLLDFVYNTEVNDTN